MDTAIETAYAMGKTAASVNTTNVQVTYHVQHTHGDYCYPAATASVSYSERCGHNEEWAEDWGRFFDTYHAVATYTCNVCGRSFSYDRQSRSSYHRDEAMANAANQYYAHLTNGRCRVKGIQCGKSAGLQDITDVSILGAGDNVISATIDF